MPEGFNEEQRQQMFEEMQQKSIEACAGKTESENCQIEGFRGIMEGTCETQEENLICRFQRPERPNQ